MKLSESNKRALQILKLVADQQEEIERLTKERDVALAMLAPEGRVWEAEQSQNYLSRKDASAYLLNRWCIKRGPGHLANLAVAGGGPAFYKAGRDTLYSRSDLDRWARETLGSPAQTATEHRSGAPA